MIRNSQSGFTLIELAIVLMIAGLMMAGAMAMMKPYVETARINATRQKLDNISDALALFVQTHHRLPCPAAANPTGGEPFGAPTHSGPDGTDITETCGNGGSENIPDDYLGIVPFRALGLTEDNVRDGYGNLITYGVSAVLAGLTAGTPNEVHEVCRTPAWYDPAAPTTNINPDKAGVCCVRFRNNVDLIVVDGLGSTDSVFTGLHSNNNPRYANPNTPGPNPPNDFETSLIAYILVSNGANGDGSYIANSNLRNPVTADAGAQESENQNDDLTFVDRAISKANDANYFDDIVKWETNAQLISHFGNNSCGNPR